jgi:hypothetical protein
LNGKMVFKLVNDIVMTILMLFGLAYYITGTMFHEVIGVMVLILFIFHNFLNRRWYQALFKGNFNVRRILQIAINLLFLVTMFLMMISAVMISNHLFALIPINNDMILRQIHVQTAYWGFIIMAIHIGFSWGIVLHSVRRMTRITGISRTRTLALRILAVLIVVYGVHSSFKGEMGSKLFIYNPFGWFSDDSTIRFLIEHLSIMGIYICGTHYTLKFIHKKEKEQNKTSDKVLRVKDIS